MKKVLWNHDWYFGKAGGRKQAVTLPHDAMIHEARVPGHPSGSAQAFFPGGKYLYEKTFDRPADAHVIFQFEGVYKNAVVSINGREAGSCRYGYLPFSVCADEYLVEGENTITVACENEEQPDSRWYTGAGIYRPVWMWTGPKSSIEPSAVKIRTVSIDPARVRVMTDCDGEPAVQVLDGETVVAEGKGYDVELTVPDAVLWSEDSPKLYTCRVTADGDAAVSSFGIRTIRWDNKGLYINGKPTLLRGGCVHHDNGILGAATPDEADFRRAKKLKEAGFNAIRSAHNPISRAMMDACDKLGLQNRILQLYFRSIGQSEKGIAVLLLPVFPSEGLLGHGNKHALFSVHDLQVLHHKHPIQGDGGNGLDISHIHHAVYLCFDFHGAPLRSNKT